MAKYNSKSSSVPHDRKNKTSVSLRTAIISILFSPLRGELERGSRPYIIFKDVFVILPKSIVKTAILLFTLQTLLTLQTVLAQPVTQEWVRNYPGPSNDLIGPFLAVDKQGNSYIAGTHVIDDSINILCVKYNTSGVQQWATLYKYPGEGYFAPTGIAIDSSGNAYVISYYGETYLQPLNGLIAKFNSINASRVWAKRYIGQYGESAFRDIRIDRMNNIYVVGVSDTSHLVIRYNTNGDSVWVRKYHPRPLCREGARTCTLDDSLNIIYTGLRRFYYPPYGYYDSLLTVKYSPVGDLRWESVYAYDILANVGTKITADQNGNTYIGGVTRVSGFGVYLTLKYDRNGVRQWAKIYDAPDSGSNTLNGIAMDNMNNALYVTGNAVANDIRVAATIRYNTFTGDSIWVKKDTGIYSNGSANDMVVDSSGYIYITGSTANIPPTMGGPMTIKYSANGNIVWLVTYEGPGRATNLQLDNLRNIYICGPFIPGYILIKYSQLLGIKPLSNKVPQEFCLKQNFPNPFNSSTVIKFSIPKKCFVQIQIYDILGKLADTPLNEEIGASEYELRIDAAKYSSGVYFYRLIADGNIIDTKKLVLLK